MLKNVLAGPDQILPNGCRTTAGSTLYAYGEPGAREDVWMSHGDSVVQLPTGFIVVAKSDQVRGAEGACRGWVAGG